MHDRAFFIEKNIATLGELLPYAAERGVGIMLENLPGDFNTAQQVGELLDPLPELGLHLDIGHANLMVLQSTVGELLAAYGSRLRHVHLHDNKGGGADLHLPLGTGSVDVRGAIRALQGIGYDGTITLEVFTPDRHHLAYSRDSLQRIWSEEKNSSSRWSTSRTLAASSSGVNGLGKNSSTPAWLNCCSTSMSP